MYVNQINYVKVLYNFILIFSYIPYMVKKN